MKILEFCREDDGLIYTFNLDGEYNGHPRWLREDKGIAMVFIDHVGWCVLDEDQNQVSWPFLENRDIEANLPPEGKWLSWKNGKSYVYVLSLR